MKVRTNERMNVKIAQHVLNLRPVCVQFCLCLFVFNSVDKEEKGTNGIRNTAPLFLPHLLQYLAVSGQTIVGE